jgi:hypothetical protein
MGAPIPYSPEIPWVLVTPVEQLGWTTKYEVMCTVCGARGLAVGSEPARGFAMAHRAHTAGPRAVGLGDAVAAVAKPIARFFGQKPCTPCEARRHALNNARIRW